MPLPLTAKILDGLTANLFAREYTKETPESRGALKGLLSDVLGQPVEVMAITANEPPIIDIRDRQIRYDISCKLENGELVNIEMTMHPDAFEYSRLEYYAARLQASQEIKGQKKSYKDLHKSYQISIFVQANLFHDDELVHEFIYYDPKTNTSLGRLSSIITVELLKLDSGKSPDEMSSAELWATFFRYSRDRDKRTLVNAILDKREEIAMAAHTLIHISKDEIERARYESEYKAAVDLQSLIVTAEWEGIEKGRIEGREEGIEKGRIEGHAEGIEKGRNEALFTVIQEMLADKMSIDQISRYAGMTVEAIHRLLGDNNNPLQKT